MVAARPETGPPEAGGCGGSVRKNSRSHIRSTTLRRSGIGVVCVVVGGGTGQPEGGGGKRYRGAGVERYGQNQERRTNWW